MSDNGYPNLALVIWEEQEDEEMLVPHQEFTEGPQPMEDNFIPTEIASAPENQQVWRILLRSNLDGR
ncbi:hypothetical protein OPV22_007504 [Ensete ventricosum]|uniref:Uncharacterized protein n=1 Tax=Ensete ventricosum TaxID=4639 RepID=A0AAV8RRV0_ENSVE|nr:hypothetical protein OPV22_007504 [Ensete ventricosum]